MPQILVELGAFQNVGKKVGRISQSGCKQGGLGNPAYVSTDILKCTRRIYHWVTVKE